jgi:peroxiredoxin (alkyl hydroperoxide reductase subunit C)
MQQSDVRVPLPRGVAAPQFTLRVSPRKSTSLGDWKGTPVVLLFYVADFSPVCSDELAVFNELMPIFIRRSTRIFGISVDSVWSHSAWSRERRFRFPLLSDFHPKGDVARSYHVWREEDGTSERALFVLDSAGRVFWSYLSPIEVNPGADGVLDALDDLAAFERDQPRSLS